jgi:hypothetical protein
MFSLLRYFWLALSRADENVMSNRSAKIGVERKQEILGAAKKKARTEVTSSRYHTQEQARQGIVQRGMSERRCNINRVIAEDSRIASNKYSQTSSSSKDVCPINGRGRHIR